MAEIPITDGTPARPTDTRADSDFPPPPIRGSERLVPITSWHGMVCETAVTGVEFDEYWYEGVESGVVYFFRWLDGPRATVLVVCDGQHPVHIECRSLGAALVPEREAEPILAEVTHLFREAGAWRDAAIH
ncbi:MAG TPA: hypothetical protein VJ576_19595 [Rhodocyclaceae bacterium]|nr:hypothetical protein [Rhodocyclaceae bacterium]